MSAYYNENNPHMADWLEWLIQEGLIPPGWVDRRSIKLVQPHDLEGFIQCHFFAGLGGWAYAARLAGWPDDRPLWSGSCPCQGLSSAGKRLGAADPRHLWPDFYRLIDARRPPVVVGEQVAQAAGRDWFDGVASDLGSSGYACRTCDIPALAVNSPQIRQRLWWLARPMGRAGSVGLGRWAQQPERHERNGGHAGRAQGTGWLAESNDECCTVAGGHGGRPTAQPGHHGEGGSVQGGSGPYDGSPLSGRDNGTSRGVVNAAGIGWREGRPEPVMERWGPTVTGATVRSEPVALGGSQGEPSGPGICELDAAGGWRSVTANTNGAHAVESAKPSGCEGWDTHRPDGPGPGATNAPTDTCGGDPWARWHWIICHDGKARRIPEPGFPLLAHGVPARVVKWRGVGNAIVPQLAAEVLAAYLDTECPHCTGTGWLLDDVALGPCPCILC